MLHVQTYVFFMLYFISNTNTHILKQNLYAAGIRDMSYHTVNQMKMNINNNGNGMVLDGW